MQDARSRVEAFLHTLARKYQNRFYLFAGDFTKFFDSLRHIDCLRVLRETHVDRMLQGLGMKIARMYRESELDELEDLKEQEHRSDELRHHRGVGMTLGSQESQTMALAIPSGVDHAAKDKLGIKAYVRYMDDTMAGDISKERLKIVRRVIQAEAEKIGLAMNPKKTVITKASKGIKLIQIHYRVTSTGHLVRTLARAGVVRMRRKLKAFRRLVDRGLMQLEDVFASFAAWLGNSKHADAYRQRKRMLTLYNKLFGMYRTKGVYA